MERPPPQLAPLSDLPWLVDTLAEVTARPRPEVWRTLCEVARNPSEVLEGEIRQWGIEPYVWSDRLREYYAQTSSYLYGGVIWNRNLYKVQVRQWIASYLATALGPGQRILTIGDGIGGDSCHLAQCGHRVTYWDPGEQCRGFARRLFAKCGQDVSILEDSQQIEPGTYDVVLCLDVLEHVPDPPALVAQFADHLQPGGLLIVHAPFYFVSRRNATHLDCNRKYSGDLRRLYESHGFRLCDGRLFWDPLVLQKHGGGPERAVKAHGGWIAVLRAVGWLLAVGRLWCGPHNLVASGFVGQGRLKGLDEMEPPAGCTS